MACHVRCPRCKDCVLWSVYLVQVSQPLLYQSQIEVVLHCSVMKSKQVYMPVGGRAALLAPFCPCSSGNQQMWKVAEHS